MRLIILTRLNKIVKGQSYLSQHEYLTENLGTKIISPWNIMSSLEFLEMFEDAFTFFSIISTFLFYIFVTQRYRKCLLWILTENYYLSCVKTMQLYCFCLQISENLLKIICFFLKVTVLVIFSIALTKQHDQRNL